MTCKTSEPYSAGRDCAATVTETLSKAQVKRSAIDAGDQGQQGALCQQLPDKAPPAGAKGEAQTQFILAGGSTRELQAGDIGAGDDQHHSDGDHDEQNGELQSAIQVAGERRARPRRAR